MGYFSTLYLLTSHTTHCCFTVLLYTVCLHFLPSCLFLRRNLGNLLVFAECHRQTIMQSLSAVRSY